MPLRFVILVCLSLRLWVQPYCNDSGGTQMARRRIAPLLLLQVCHFSALFPHFRRHKMSIQRLHGSVPSAISADYLAIYAKIAFKWQYSPNGKRLKEWYGKVQGYTEARQ